MNKFEKVYLKIIKLQVESNIVKELIDEDLLDLMLEMFLDLGLSVNGASEGTVEMLLDYAKKNPKKVYDKIIKSIVTNSGEDMIQLGKDGKFYVDGNDFCSELIISFPPTVIDDREFRKVYKKFVDYMWDEEFYGLDGWSGFGTYGSDIDLDTFEQVHKIFDPIAKGTKAAPFISELPSLSVDEDED